MENNQVIYQFYTLGFCGAPNKNDGITVDRIRRVIDWIPHLKRLGITAVWFCPVFESVRHGYDTVDLRKIDCRLGTNDDFRDVCDALHDANIAVILDAVFNHVGRSFPYFVDIQEKRQASSYNNWFYIDYTKTDKRDGFDYADWEGFHDLVKLNLKNPEVVDYLLSSVDQWIDDYGIDGLRIDAAWCIDKRFLKKLKRHVKKRNPKFFLLGEMTWGNYGKLLKDSTMDSITNYDLRETLWNSFNSRDLTNIASLLLKQFGENGDYCGKPLLSFADNHDVNRIASVLERKEDLPLVYALLTAVPGIPCIYYGSEWGTEGKRGRWSDKELRPEFEKPLWNELSDLLATMNRFRTAYPVFTDGDYEPLVQTRKQLVFRRQDKNGQLIFAMNIAEEAVRIHLQEEIDYAIDLRNGEYLSHFETINVAPQQTVFLYSER